MKTKTKEQFFKPNVPQRITNLSWKQAKARFPRLNPYGDADKDRVKNFRDCKPFDIKRQGKEHDEEDEGGRVTATEDVRRCPKCGGIMATSNFTDNWEGFKCFRCGIIM